MCCVRSQDDREDEYDISERKALERKVREMEANYRILEEHMEDVIWRLDLATMKFNYVSPSVERLRGYTVEEVMAQPMEEVMTPESLAYLQQILPGRIERAIDNPQDRSSVDMIAQPCKDGTIVWTEVTTRFVFREDGTMEVVGVSRNYNKQKQQQEELAAAYKELEKEKAFLRAMMDAAPSGVCCVNRDGQILYINTRCANGLDIDVCSKKMPLFYEIIPPNLQKKHIELFEKCLQGFTLPFLEKDPLPQKTQFGYLYGVYNPFMNAAGEVERVVIVTMDITAQKEMERQLLEAQRIAKMGSWEWDLQKKCFTCSDGLLALFRVDSETVARESYHAFLAKVYPDGIDNVGGIFHQLRQDHIPVQWEFQIGHEEHDIRTLQSTINLTFNQEGKPIKIIGSLVDITDYRRMEELQREAATRLRDFARAMPDIGFISTEDGQIVEMFDNKELRQKKTFVKDLKKIMCKKDAGELLEKVHYALLHNTVQFGEYMLDTAIGKRMFEMRIAPMSYVTDGKHTVACNAIDVTDKNRAQKLLQLSYEKRRQREILNDLVEGKTAPSQLVLDQAWRVKLNLARPYSCYLVVVKAWKGETPEHWQEHREEYQFFIDSLTDVLAAEMEAIACESWEGIGVLCPWLSSGKKEIKEYELSKASHMKEIVYAHFPDVSIVIGIGEFNADTFHNIVLVYSQACEAVYSGQAMCSDQELYHYLDLGIFQILPLLSDREKVLSFIERTIGKLLEYDRKRGSHLVATMDKILQIDNLKTVAEEMLVHHKTIAFRKKRIEKILGVSLDTLDNKTTLNTALKLRQLLYMKKEVQKD